jgi:dTDP-4-amino-4,6-dideoxygalactose transaminase
MRLFRGHGITRDKKYIKKENPENWYYEQISLGYNYRMTDISAALGISQLKRVEEYVLKRNELAQKYKHLLKESRDISPQIIDGDCYSSYHLFVVQLHSEKKIKRNDVVNSLISKGIGAMVHYIPVHLQPYYINLGFKKGSFVNAEKYYENTITLPLYPDLSIEQLSYISTSLREILEN